MPERWAVTLAENMRGRNHLQGEQTIKTMLAYISSAKPLTLLVNGKLVTRNLYVNPAMMLEADDVVDRMNLIFQSTPAPPALFEFLKSFHQKCMLHKGDMVIALQLGTSFYICQKVVAAG